MASVSNLIQVKSEAVDLVDIESKIVDLCKSNAKGIVDSDVKAALHDVSTQQYVKAINRLLSTGQIELLKSGTKLLYKYKDSQAASKTKGFEAEEKLIYQVIESSDNKGIWIRDIRFKCNLPMTQVNKVLKNLESKKLIKSVTSVGAGKKKVYMLYNMVPDTSVTGGAWYSDQDFEAEFVDILNQQCHKFLLQKLQQAQEMKIDPLLQRNRSYASSQEVWKYISELGISKVSLTIKDIETILSTLLYDGMAEMIIVSDSSMNITESGVIQKKLYRAVKPLLPVTGLMRIPCGVCPVVKNCYPGGLVSPQSCVYIKEWLDSF